MRQCLSRVSGVAEWHINGTARCLLVKAKLMFIKTIMGLAHNLSSPLDNNKEMHS